ncbi:MULTISPECIES: hypothetical protein [Mesorhizobium]|uniref:hypothetical protein n=1 Tax=Mesorhizobium TaxID=68287 RepID=UPI0012EBA600|nr:MULTISPECIES: hypothetical protein [Mesorhizobium]WJI40627.1 hypothetical protein NL534_10425 [Mesorhizobium opportunistum]
MDDLNAVQHQAAAICLRDSDIQAATRCLVTDWFTRSNCVGPAENLEPERFGLLSPYLAKAAVLENGDDFLFVRWGQAMSLLCGGDRCGDRLSTLSQPSRSHLRRVCVRALSSRSPALNRATWVLDGEVWHCTLLAMPAQSDRPSVSSLVIALIFAPHPMFADKIVPEGFGWPAAVVRGGIHKVGQSAAIMPTEPRTTRNVFQFLRLRCRQ